jgi:hypothetical protein
MAELFDSAIAMDGDSALQYPTRIGDDLGTAGRPVKLGDDTL